MPKPVPSRLRQPCLAAEPLHQTLHDVLFTLRASRLAAPDVIEHDVAFAHDLEHAQRFVERRRHRDRAARASLRRARDAAAHLLVHRDRLRDHVDVLAPAQPLDLTNA